MNRSKHKLSGIVVAALCCLAAALGVWMAAPAAVRAHAAQAPDANGLNDSFAHTEYKEIDEDGFTHMRIYPGANLVAETGVDASQPLILEWLTDVSHLRTQWIRIGLTGYREIEEAHDPAKHLFTLLDEYGTGNCQIWSGFNAPKGSIKCYKDDASNAQKRNNYVTLDLPRATIGLNGKSNASMGLRYLKTMRDAPDGKVYLSLYLPEGHVDYVDIKIRLRNGKYEAPDDIADPNGFAWEYAESSYYDYFDTTKTTQFVMGYGEAAYSRRAIDLSKPFVIDYASETSSLADNGKVTLSLCSQPKTQSGRLFSLSEEGRTGIVHVDGSAADIQVLPKGFTRFRFGDGKLRVNGTETDALFLSGSTPTAWLTVTVPDGVGTASIKLRILQDASPVTNSIVNAVADDNVDVTVMTADGYDNEYMSAKVELTGSFADTHDISRVMFGSVAASRVQTASGGYVYAAKDTGLQAEISVTVSEKTYGITVQPSAGGTLSCSTYTASRGETVRVTPLPDTGYSMSALYVNGVRVKGTSFVPTRDSVVRADFAAVGYTLSTSADVTVENKQSRYHYKDKVRFTVDVPAGKYIESFGVAEGSVISAEDTGYTLYMPAINTSIRPVFADYVTLACETPQNGTVALSAEKCRKGEEVTVDPHPVAGYTLKRITVNGKEISGYVFTAEDGAYTVRCEFVPANSTDAPGSVAPAKLTKGQIAVTVIMCVLALAAAGLFAAYMIVKRKKAA